MMAIRHLRAALVLTVAAAACGPAADSSAQSASNATGRSPGMVPLPAHLELELARSALPPHLRDEATYYTWAAGVGYRRVVEGANGFSALVGRDDPNSRLAPWTLAEYEPDVLIPIAFDAAGEGHLRVYLDLGRMRATGVPASEAQRRLRVGVASGEYPSPSRPGISYMVSPLLRAYRSAHADSSLGTFMTPHYMFYAPDLSPADLGATGDDLTHPVMLNPEADPHGVVVVVMGQTEREAIRRRWSELLDQICALHDAWCVPGGGD